MPISPDPLAVRPGKIGIGVPTSQWTNFNNATGNYTFTSDIQFLVQEDNIGHLERGTFGGTGSGDLWSAYGAPFEGFFPNFYGVKFQWGPYAINYQLQARGTSNFDNQVKDAQIAWNSGNGTSPGRGRLDIGNLDAGNQFNPRMSFLDNGNVGIGTDAPIDKLQIEGGNLLLDNGREIRFGPDIVDSFGRRPPTIRGSSQGFRFFPSAFSTPFISINEGTTSSGTIQIISSRNLEIGRRVGSAAFRAITIGGPNNENGI